VSTRCVMCRWRPIDTGPLGPARVGYLFANPSMNALISRRTSSSFDRNT
jgi:hypothetical protein